MYKVISPSQRIVRFQYLSTVGYNTVTGVSNIGITPEGVWLIHAVSSGADIVNGLYKQQFNEISDFYDEYMLLSYDIKICYERSAIAYMNVPECAFTPNVKSISGPTTLTEIDLAKMSDLNMLDVS